MRRVQTFQEIAGAPRYLTGRLVILEKSFVSPIVAFSVLITGPDEPPLLKPSVTANSKPYDRVDGKHELATARAVIPRPRTPGIFLRK